MKARVSDGCLRDSRTIYHPRPRRPSTLSGMRPTRSCGTWPRLRRPRTDSCTGTHRAAANVARPPMGSAKTPASPERATRNKR